jgi:ribosomal-protein-alanine N-acetyltransferase
MDDNAEYPPERAGVDEAHIAEDGRVPILEAQRLILRPCTPDDTEDLFSIFSDPQVMRFWNTPSVKEPEAAATFFKHIDHCSDLNGLRQWVIVRRQDRVVVGTCTLMHVSLTHRRAELAYALARNYWGNGYMREGLRRLLGFAFGQMGLARLEADVDPRNHASIRTLELLGFRREGHLRERWFVNGEFQDALWYGLLAREWVP